MVLKYVISPYPTLLENMVVKIWEAGNDGVGAEVSTNVIPERDGAGVPTVGAGHQVPYVLTVNGLDKVVHIVRMYAAVSGALLHEYNAEPREDIVTIFDPIRFKIGDGGDLTPAGGTNVYNNPLLNGLAAADYLVHRNGYGFLVPDLHYEGDADDEGFTLLDGDVFNDDPNGEEFVIMLKPKIVSTVVNDSVVGKWFGGFYDIEANTNYDAATHLRKLGRFSGTCSFTFQALDAVPIGYGFAFNHFGNTDGVGTVKFLNAPLRWGAGTKSEMDISRYKEGCFVYDGTAWNVVYLVDSTLFDESPDGYNSGETIAIVNIALGNVPRDATAHVITHNLAIVGDYAVFPSVMGFAASEAADTNVMVSWRHMTDGTKANKVTIVTREMVGTTSPNNIFVFLLIVKT